LSQAQLIFAVLAMMAVVTAVGVVLFDSPVRAALSLVLNFFTLALMYFTLQAQLLGIVQILVYTGAIMVLFLFVIMLLNLGGLAREQAKIDAKGGLAILVGAGLFGVTLAQVVLPIQGFVAPVASPEYGTPQAVGNTLFSAYVWPFEVASILLLVGIVGSILLAKRRI